MGKCKKTILLILCVIIQVMGFVFPVVFFLRAANIVSTDWYGFGVDSEGYVYIGKPSEISVYEEGNCVRRIDIPQYRSYYFSIENDEILLASPSFIYTFDLNGNLLSKESDPSASAYTDLQWRREVLTSTGERYRRTHHLFRDAVVRADKTIVYQMQLGDYLARILYYLSCASFVILGIKMLLDRKFKMVKSR